MFLKRTLDLRDELMSHKDLLEVVFNHNGEPAQPFEARVSMEILLDYFSALTEYDVVDHLQSLEVPTLILRGETDPVVDRNMVKPFDEVPSSTLVEVPGHGHYLPLTGARTVNRALADFWSDINDD